MCVLAYSALTLLVGRQSSDEVLVWLSVWSEVRIVYVWSSWCHCHPKTPSFLVSFKSGLVSSFLYRVTHVVLKKTPLSGSSSITTSDINVVICPGDTLPSRTRRIDPSQFMLHPSGTGSQSQLQPSAAGSQPQLSLPSRPLAIPSPSIYTNNGYNTEPLDQWFPSISDNGPKAISRKVCRATSENFLKSQRNQLLCTLKWWISETE